jgi:hypothetical protein
MFDKKLFTIESILFLAFSGIINEKIHSKWKYEQ